ncbi:MAG: hypothetical protein HC925_08845 [Coleofasciculaceae cyanobacterium SM2_3_26]|nr:hypothetical protein [Coleofasciculaceae cyanobacterium SM2_3_26]
MREKVDELEARSEAAALAGRDPVEQQFKELEAGNSIEDELAALKANRPVGQTENPSLPAPGKAADPDVEAALEELRALEAAKESQDTN